MKRTDLEKAVRAVAPALATTDETPALVCVCFEGDQMHAYDDTVAIVVQMEDTGFVGGVRGKLLLDWVSSSRAKDVTVEHVDGTESVTFKAGSAKLKTSVVPSEEYLFDGFDVEKDGVHIIPISDEVIKALTLVQATVSNDLSLDWAAGVTIGVVDGYIYICSCDNISATLVWVEADELTAEIPDRTAFILHPRFVSILLAHSKAQSKMLYLCDEFIGACADDTWIFSRALPGARIDQYVDMFQHADDVLNHMTKMPKRFAAMMDRAAMVARGEKGTTTNVKIAKGRMTFVTESSYGRVRDVVKVDCKATVETNFVPSVVLHGIGSVQSFLVEADRIWFAGDDEVGHIFMVSASA